MNTYSRISDLPLHLDGYTVEGLARPWSTSFIRRSTLVHLRGRGLTGTGEDVTYEPSEHLAFHSPPLPVTGATTLGEFSRRLDDVDLFRKRPGREASLRYRRWAFESAALDLALLQAGASLADVLERPLHPVRFVVSLNLGDPPSLDHLERLLERYPVTRIKVDAAPRWTDDVLRRLVDLDVVDIIDFKAHSGDLPVAMVTDGAGAADLAGAFAHAWLEDPTMPDALGALRGVRHRVTWDAPITSVNDIVALPFVPRMVNLKPSRFGTLQRLFDAYDHCDRQGIGMYGGGQFELGAGRQHIQYLAAAFHPDTPNDVAPSGYHEIESGLPASPLGLAAAPAGFRLHEPTHRVA